MMKGGSEEVMCGGGRVTMALMADSCSALKWLDCSSSLTRCGRSVYEPPSSLPLKISAVMGSWNFSSAVTGALERGVDSLKRSIADGVSNMLGSSDNNGGSILLRGGAAVPLRPAKVPEKLESSVEAPAMEPGDVDSAPSVGVVDSVSLGNRALRRLGVVITSASAR